MMIDAELFADAKAGKQRAVDRVFAILRGPMLRCARQELGRGVDRQEAEDAVQDALVDVFAELAEIPTADDIVPVALTITRRRARDVARTNTRRRYRLTADTNLAEASAEGGAGASPSAEAQAMRAEETHLFHKAIEALPPELRDFYAVWATGAHSMEDLGHQFGISCGEARGRVLRIEAALHAHVAGPPQVRVRGRVYTVCPGSTIPDGIERVTG